MYFGAIEGLPPRAFARFLPAFLKATFCCFRCAPVRTPRHLLAPPTLEQRQGMASSAQRCLLAHPFFLHPFSQSLRLFPLFENRPAPAGEFVSWHSFPLSRPALHAFFSWPSSWWWVATPQRVIRAFLDRVLLPFRAHPPVPESQAPCLPCVSPFPASSVFLAEGLSNTFLKTLLVDGFPPSGNLFHLFGRGVFYSSLTSLAVADLFPDFFSFRLPLACGFFDAENPSYRKMFFLSRAPFYDEGDPL